jgi:hypothetical protein
MKTLHLVALTTTIGLASMPSAPGQGPVAVEGRVLAAIDKKPVGVGAFTVKAYPVEAASNASEGVSRTNKPLAQTLTLTDGTYSLSISTTVKAVVLRFEKLTYFPVPPQQTVQLTPPKTTVPDVAAVKYSYGQSVSTSDLVDALSIRQASFNHLAANLPLIERENARRKSLEVDLAGLQKAGVDSGTIMAVKEKLPGP